MSRRKKEPLRPLTDDERRTLERISRAQSLPAAQVQRAKLFLAVADGMSYLEAAHSVGRRSNDAVSHLVSRFAESIQRLLKRRALEGSQPTTTDEIIAWLEAVAAAWNRNPTPFEWGGKRAARRAVNGSADMHKAAQEPAHAA